MRNFFYKFRFLMVAFLVVGITSLSLVNAKNENNDGIFGEQIGRLAEQIGRLADAITGQMKGGDDVVGNEENSLQLTAYGVSNPTCFDNYIYWKNSYQFNPNAPYSTHLFYSAFNSYEELNNMIKNNFLDINGDGLLDYLYHVKSYHEDYNANSGKECLLLNNGQGWDIAYRCVITLERGNDSYKTHYYGDCADVN